MTKKLALKILAWGLTFLYGAYLLLWFVSDGSFDRELILFVALLVSAIGLILQKSWAYKAIVASSVVAGLSDAVDIFVLRRNQDEISFLFLILCLFVAFLYSRPQVRLYAWGQRQDADWKILLIDDDRTFVRLMRQQFFNKGIILSTAETGERGIEMARKKVPDLIILDVILPGLKGREVCTKLKEESRTRDIPVIFLTVKSSPDDVKGEMEVGGISHMTKPVNFPDLYAEIKKILGS